MLSFPPSPSVRIFVGREPVDMRKGFDGLSGVVIGTVDEDPQSGHLFVVCNKRRNRMEALVWDGSGYWVLYKRLEHGRFQVFDRMSTTRGAYELSSTDLVASARWHRLARCATPPVARRDRGRSFQLKSVPNGTFSADVIRVTGVAELEPKLEASEEQREILARENKILRDEVALLKRGLFGRRSEHLEPGQLDIFGFEAPAHSTEIPAAPTQPAAKKKTGHGRALLSPNLPREVIELDLAEAARVCDCCGKPLKLIGEQVTERGHMIPSRLMVKRYVRPKYACPDGHEVKTASLPDGVIDGGKYEASVYAHVATAKYADHLPLHRLEGIFKRYGVQLAKQSMWDMLVRVDELVAQPVIAQMRSELLEEPVLHADETPVTMRQEDGKGTKTGYAWGWRNLHRANEPSKALVEFRTSRGRDGPLRFLGDWSGTLIVDGYAGYDEVIRANRIRRAGCWAHARRKVKEPLDTRARDAADVFALLVQRLFDVERPINVRVQAGEMDRDQQLEERRAAREASSRPIVVAIYTEVDRLERLRSTLPKSKLGKGARLPAVAANPAVGLPR